MRITLNGGHCPGKDPGAIGAVSEEAEICRRIMELAAADLREQGFEVLSVQADDLGPVVEASNGFESAVFVAIHCNGADNAVAHGAEVFAMSEEGELLAAGIQDRLVAIGGLADRGVKDGSWLYVLNQTEAVAVLVETAFITNEADEALLLTVPERFAAAISSGIADYCRERGEE